ncbi:MAG: winged helix-turn-helix domain-containing protein [Anaerolineae bacterium]
MPEEISPAQARRLALRCQGLDGAWDLPPGTEGVAQAVQRLGYVQIDTIHVVQRAHHHVLWARCPGYDPQMLHELLAEDRRVFEWWTHAASYIPVSDYRFYAPRMGFHALSPHQTTWSEEHPDVLDRVLDRIREEGPQGAADFKAPDGFEGGSWWSGWKPAKRALEVLFNLGKLAVSERRNFQRLYDLRERVIPDGADVPVPDQAETDAFIIRRSVGSLGAVPQSEIAWWRDVRPSEGAIERAVEQGLIMQVLVEGQEGEPWYAWTAGLEGVFDASLSSSMDNGDDALHLLSPFDNLIIRRRWMERLFDGFDYRLECYLPQEKRQYGYFALPILWDDRFIGRVDTKADRGPGRLLVRQLTFEPDFEDFEPVLPLLAEKLWAFARFNGCRDVSLEVASPESLREPLADRLKDIAS